MRTLEVCIVCLIIYIPADSGSMYCLLDPIYNIYLRNLEVRIVCLILYIPADPGRLEGLVGQITTLVALLEMSSTACGDKVPRIEGLQYGYCSSMDNIFFFMLYCSTKF